MTQATQRPVAPGARTLEAYLERVVAVQRVPGACVALEVGDAAYALTAGRSAVDDSAPLPFHTRFEIGCIVKTLLAAVALELCNEGTIALDAPIGRLLPELERSRKGARIEVRHLMSHTTGYAGIGMLDRDDVAIGWEELVERVRAAPQLFEPGTVYNYDQTAGVLLAGIIEKATGRASASVVEERILAPLGDAALQDEASSPAAVGHVLDAATRSFVRSAAGELPVPWRASMSDRTLSVRAMTALARLLMTGESPVSGRRVLSSFTVERLARRVVDLPAIVGGAQSRCLPVGSGLGLATFRHGMHGHDGTGRGQVLGFRFSRRHGVALAVGVNAQASWVRRRLVEAVLAELGFAPPAQPGSIPLSVELDRLPGRYAGLAGREVAVTLEGGEIGIALQAPGRRPARLATGTVDPDGCLSIRAGPMMAGVAFFEDPSSGDPCLMLGVHALKKLADDARVARAG